MKDKIRLNSILFILFMLLCFPLFYFVYKYGSPYLGMIDFFDYYKLYSNMDYKAADSPLNMRLVSSFIVFCMSKTGFVYHTICQVDGAPFSKVIYFNAVFFNYLSVVATCVMLFHLIRNQGNSTLFGFIGGLIYLLGFGTIFFEIMPLTDAFSVLMFTILLWYNQKRSYAIIVPLIILILQREYILMAFGLMLFIEYVRYRQKYELYVLIVCVMCFVTHVILRKTIFETPRYSYHTNPEFMMNSVLQISLPGFTFIKQLFMTMNIGLIYGFIVGYKVIKGMPINRPQFFTLLFLFAQLLLLTFLLGLGNNAGRYFYILVPYIILQIINEIKVFESFLIKHS